MGKFEQCAKSFAKFKVISIIGIILWQKVQFLKSDEKIQKICKSSVQNRLLNSK